MLHPERVLMGICKSKHHFNILASSIQYIYIYNNTVIALIAHSAEEIQRIVDAFATTSSKFGLKINILKTEVMYQPNSTTDMEEDINVEYTTLNPVQECTYIGKLIALKQNYTRELQRTACLSGAFEKYSGITIMYP